MPFDTLSQRLQIAATGSLRFLTDRYGRRQLKLEEQISPSVSWIPTFYFASSRYKKIAVEVSDDLYPEVLKIAKHDIVNSRFPIAVFVACPEDIYFDTKSAEKIKALTSHGFGLITVAPNGVASLRSACIPLAQFITDEEVADLTSKLPMQLRTAIRNAHQTYLTREGQGLQEMGQIVEALVDCLSGHAVVSGWTSRSSINGKSKAEVIDVLYGLEEFRGHRAALGGGRSFLKDYRNVASHAPSSAKQAAEKIKACRDGFLNGARLSKNLAHAAKVLKVRLKLHLT